MSPTKIIASGLLDGLRLDARWVLRQIRSSFAFSAVVVVLLAAGLGVAAAIFSTVRTVLLSPLPYKDSEQLVQIISTWPKTGDRNDWSAPYRDALDWKANVAAFRDVGMYRYSLLNLTESVGFRVLAISSTIRFSEEAQTAPARVCVWWPARMRKQI